MSRHALLNPNSLPRSNRDVIYGRSPSVLCTEVSFNIVSLIPRSRITFYFSTFVDIPNLHFSRNLGRNANKCYDSNRDGITYLSES